MSSASKIIALYNSGLSIAAICKAGHGSKPTITKILRAAGVSIRKGVPKLALPVEEINRKYREDKLSTYELAALYKCSDETIRKIIKDKRTTVENNNLRGDETLKKISESCAKKWTEDEYRHKVKEGTSTKEYKAALSKSAKEHNNLGRFAKTPKGRESASKRATELWKSDDYRSKQAKHNWRLAGATRASVNKLQNDEHARAEWLSKLRNISANRRLTQPKVSMQQKQLYYVLSRIGIRFFAEGPDTMISDFYIVDCIVPKQGGMDKDYIIEVQGEYWHSLDKAKIKDQQKQTYITNNTKYGLLELTELDFKSYASLQAKLAAIGVVFDRKKCIVDQLIINKIDEDQAKMFYETFHYLATVRKGAITYGAFLGDDLVACISYTRPIRKQISKKYNDDVFEISRLAIAVDIQCENLASWFISKTMRMVDASTIISYSDTSAGHTGTVYKASNFKMDGIVAPDYHYVSPSGARYHKKTVWDRSKRFKMTEVAYAELHGLRKITTGHKHRWVFHKDT